LKSKGSRSAMKIGYPNLPPGISKIKIGSGNYNATGPQDITGVGFVPKIVIFFAYGLGGAGKIFSHGFDDSAVHRCVFSAGHLTDISSSGAASMVVQIDGTNVIYGSIQFMLADGFRINWTLTGTATAYFTYIAMR